jgi:hypothetical protein
MAVSPKSIRTEVLDYIKACWNLLRNNPGSHDQFIIASLILQEKDGRYTDEELALVQKMVLRVSVKLGH